MIILSALGEGTIYTVPNTLEVTVDVDKRLIENGIYVSRKDYSTLSVIDREMVVNSLLEMYAMDNKVLTNAPIGLIDMYVKQYKQYLGESIGSDFDSIDIKYRPRIIRLVNADHFQRRIYNIVSRRSKWTTMEVNMVDEYISKMGLLPVTGNRSNMTGYLNMLYNHGKLTDDLLVENITTFTSLMDWLANELDITTVELKYITHNIPMTTSRKRKFMMVLDNLVKNNLGNVMSDVKSFENTMRRIAMLIKPLGKKWSKYKNSVLLFTLIYDGELNTKYGIFERGGKVDDSIMVRNIPHAYEHDLDIDYSKIDQTTLNILYNTLTSGEKPNTYKLTDGLFSKGGVTRYYSKAYMDAIVNIGRVLEPVLLPKGYSRKSVISTDTKDLPTVNGETVTRGSTIFNIKGMSIVKPFISWGVDDASITSGTHGIDLDLSIAYIPNTFDDPTFLNYQNYNDNDVFFTGDITSCGVYKEAIALSTERFDIVIDTLDKDMGLEKDSTRYLLITTQGFSMPYKTRLIFGIMNEKDEVVLDVHLTTETGSFQGFLIDLFTGNVINIMKPSDKVHCKTIGNRDINVAKYYEWVNRSMPKYDLK